jgi:hypothetical protein
MITAKQAATDSSYSEKLIEIQKRKSIYSSIEMAKSHGEYETTSYMSDYLSDELKNELKKNGFKLKYRTHDYMGDYECEYVKISWEHLKK